MRESKPHSRSWQENIAILREAYFGDETAVMDFTDALQELEEQLQSAETTLAHAEAFIEHMDMSYRWAEWCEGRDPNPATSSEAGSRSGQEPARTVAPASEPAKKPPTPDTAEFWGGTPGV